MKEFSILLVEDDPDIVELYKEVMENFENVAAEYLDDGDVALKAVQTTQYDCIVLDIHLPGADGLQIAKTIRDTPMNRTTPVFVISGNLDDEKLSRAQSFGVVDVMTKPFKIVELISSLRNVFESRVKVEYDASLLDAMFSSANEVFKFYLGDGVSVGRAKIKSQENVENCSIMGLVAVEGPELAGQLGVFCSSEFALEIARLVFTDLQIVGREDIVSEDSLTELCNQIMGRFKNKAMAGGVEVEIGIPKFKADNVASLSSVAENPVLYFPIGYNDLNAELEFYFSKHSCKLKEDGDDLTPTGVPLFFS